ncbi:hypothetical protein AXG93_2727s1370 [Marchantia polymorpha subsp. ruderalis]|uniref:Uncharacterized protein n=1 Tax=Marchantia polymorpha subsp. ruderalis TaxID=1480154 RepID=A0A176VDH6_MARPO|nr:hypothetical protein AXG93_2727s1370 [Marchantia polymorpha subsp. ruderalis]
MSQFYSPQQRKKRPRGRHESQPRKKRRIDEVAVAEERLCRAASIELRSPNSQTRSKMKSRRLILKADSSTESRAVVTRGRSIPEAGAEVNMVREKEAPTEKGPRSYGVRPTPVVPSQATRKEKGKAIMTEEEPLRQVEVPLTDIRMKIPLERTVEVLTVSSDTEKDRAALEKIIERAVEDVGGEACEPQKRKKYAGAIINGSYVELVRNKTGNKGGSGFCGYSEGTAEPDYGGKVPVKAKKLVDCEVARITDLELIEKLETQCSELRSQRTQAEEQSCEMETRLSEAEEKNR